MSDDIRFDSVRLPKMTKTKEGYLRGEAVVSRTGVFKYRNIDGSIRGELRHPDNIFQQDSLDTLKMIPITDDHPPEFVDATNVHKYQVGYTGERYDIDDNKVIVSMTVTHQDAIDAINSGKLELSLGYVVNLKPEQGQYEGENYDAVQLEPRYNHLALVQRGRAGSVARMRFDAAFELIEPEPAEPCLTEEINRDNFINDNYINQTRELEMTKENTVRVDALTLENEQLVVKLNDLQSKLDDLESELAEEKALKTDAIIEAKVMDRASLIAKATPFVDKAEELFKKTDREIMEATINSARTDAIDLKERSDDYVRGVFETSIAAVPREHMDASGGMAEVMRRRRNDEYNNITDMNKLPNRTISEKLKEKIFNLKESA